MNVNDLETCDAKGLARTRSNLKSQRHPANSVRISVVSADAVAVSLENPNSVASPGRLGSAS